MTAYDDPRFAAGLGSLRPCEPREYRQRRRRQILAAVCWTAVVCLIVVAWLWWHWLVAVLLTMETGALATLVVRESRRGSVPFALRHDGKGR